MAELGEAILFIVIGLIVGILALFVIMQSRLSKKAEQLFEKRKGDLDVQYKIQYGTELEKWKAEHELKHQEAVETRVKFEVNRALNGSRNTIKGRVNEQLTPLFPEFTSKYVAADARFLGSPIDFVIFKNLSTLTGDSPQPLEVILVEVKTGKSNLTSTEKAVQAAVENLRVKFETLRIAIPNSNGSPSPQVEQKERDGITQ